MNNKEKFAHEIYDKCGEHLEMIPEELWGQYLIPVFFKLLYNERELKEYYKKRLDVYEKKEAII